MKYTFHFRFSFFSPSNKKLKNQNHNLFSYKNRSLYHQSTDKTIPIKSVPKGGDKIPLKRQTKKISDFSLVFTVVHQNFAIFWILEFIPHCNQ